MQEHEPYGASFLRAREAKGISQKEAHRRSGVSVGAISMIEADKRAPSVITAWRLADAYGMTLDELVGRTPPEPPLQAGED